MGADLKRRKPSAAALAAAIALPVLLLAGCHHTPKIIGRSPDAIDEGVVKRTANPQVARYIVTPHSASQVTIEFGPTTAYGVKTWSVAATGEKSVEILVAGMRADTKYHMRADVRFPDGATVYDTDHTFTSAHYKKKLMPRIAVQTYGTPQPGVELINPSIGSDDQAIVIDLHGNVLWAYNYPDRESVFKVQMHRYLHAAHLTLRNWVQRLFGRKITPKPVWWDAKMWKRLPPERQFGTIINPVKPLPNGNFLMIIGLASHALLDSPDGAPPPDTTLALREINLAGETVHNLTVKALNEKLRATGYRGPTLEMVHHDVALLPNGHTIVIANATREYTGLPGYPETTRVIGDILVELDANWNPVWTWSEFDHLDVNRHPMDFPDWTHTNAVVYTKDDGNLLVSIRSQGWVIKIDYRNGHGSGNVLWRLGNGGDFRLLNGKSPTDWNYAQHEPAIFSDRDAGVFDIGMMDNGNNRIMSDGKSCGAKGAPACYTTVPIFHIDEKAKTATLVFHDVFPSKQYSMWGGGVQPLANDAIEIDMCNVGHNSEVYDVTRETSPHTIWHLHAGATNLYRSERMPSLYPGVQW